MAIELDGPGPVYTGTGPAADAISANESVVPYLAGERLVEAVNLALYLKRPLLLRGEPGTGKTQLARAVSQELGFGYEAWHVKSTTDAHDGLYHFDTLGRLRDIQMRQLQGKPTDAEDLGKYIRWGPLGKAFQSECRSVLLIDEIDKADIDFPNDLLLELDELRFSVEETGDVVVATHAPLVIVTSNDEKELPDAFLRRCIFHYIEFPAPADLSRILLAHFPEAPAVLVNAAVRRFTELRARMVGDRSHTGKPVTTSELIDWFRVLTRDEPDAALEMLGGRLPYASVLLKVWEDHLRYLGEA